MYIWIASNIKRTTRELAVFIDLALFNAIRIYIHAIVAKSDNSQAMDQLRFGFFLWVIRLKPGKEWPNGSSTTVSYGTDNIMISSNWGHQSWITDKICDRLEFQHEKCYIDGKISDDTSTKLGEIERKIGQLQILTENPWSNSEASVEYFTPKLMNFIFLQQKC